MTPQLRFPEFTDDWQVKKLGSLFSYEQPTKYLVSSTDYADGYDTPVLTAGKTFVLGKTDESHGIFQEGLPITLFDDFTTASQWVDFPFKLKSSAAKILKAKDGYNPKIAHEILRKIKFKADDHQRYWISTYQNFDVKIPSKPEQEKIADFLTAVDERIAVGEKKLELLETYKRGVMQKIFSQQIRFKDDNGNPYPDWEEKKLGEIARIYQPLTISQSDLTKTGYPVYGANGIIGKYDRFNHENEQIAVTCRGNTCGVINYTQPKSWITGNAMVINMDDSSKADKKFMYYQLLSQNLNYLITGSGQPQITGDIKQHKIFVPFIKEQQKIANFLTALDEKITAEKSKLTAARQFKKALLQRMFV